MRLALAVPKARMALFYDNPGAFYLALERFGYDISDGPAAVRAFQRRVSATSFDGVARSTSRTSASLMICCALRGISRIFSGISAMGRKAKDHPVPSDSMYKSPIVLRLALKENG